MSVAILVEPNVIRDLVNVSMWSLLNANVNAMNMMSPVLLLSWGYSLLVVTSAMHCLVVANTIIVVNAALWNHKPWLGSENGKRLVAKGSEALAIMTS